jgi:type I site-specific restriction endonuclease
MSKTDNTIVENQPTVAQAPTVSARAAMEKSLEAWKAKDKVLKKDELQVVVGDLRQELWKQTKKVQSLEARQQTALSLVSKKQSAVDDLQAENHELKETNKELDATNKELEERNEELEENGGASDSEIARKLKIAENELADAKAEYDRLHAATSKKIAQLDKKLEQALMASRSKNDKVNEKFLSELAEKVKTIGWGKIKFVQNHEEQIIAAKIMWKHGELQNIFADSKPMTKQMRADFIQTYSDYIRQMIFDKRSYATAEMKKWYTKQWKDGKPTLTLEDLVNCLARKIENEDQMAKFMIYWDELLAKHVGSGKWKDNTKYYNTICGAMRSDCEATIPLITPQDEAFLVLSTENHLQRWRDEHDKVRAPDKKDHSGLYTSTKNGQNQYGGWSEAGLDLFNR